MFPAVANADCVVIITDHTKVDYGAVVKQAKLILDTRNALKGFRSENIVRL
jgi:UDP-N-acetyl-D-glucosamine dehydrogenase